MNSPAPLSPSGQRASVPTSSPRTAAHLVVPVVEVYLPSDKHNLMSQSVQTSFLSDSSNSAVDDSFTGSSSCFSPEKAGSASEVCFLYRQALEQHVLPSLISLDCISKPPLTPTTAEGAKADDDDDDDDYEDDISDCMSIFSSCDLDSVVAAAEAAAANPSMDSCFFCDDADSVVIRRRQRQSFASSRNDPPSPPTSSSFHFAGMESVQPRVGPSNDDAIVSMDEDDMESIASSVDTIYSFDLDHRVQHSDSDTNRRWTI